jgi:sugar phosphate permease
MQVIAGVFQSTGWPSVVAIMANWFGKGKRGLVMGVWNAHTSLGNILGTVIAAACLQYGWGYAFIVPGLLICFMGLIVFAFLVVQPSDVGLGGGGSYEQVKTDEVRFSAAAVECSAQHTVLVTQLHQRTPCGWCDAQLPICAAGMDSEFDVNWHPVGHCVDASASGQGLLS